MYAPVQAKGLFMPIPESARIHSSLAGRGWGSSARGGSCWTALNAPEAGHLPTDALAADS